MPPLIRGGVFRGVRLALAFAEWLDPAYVDGVEAILSGS